jgi:saccharopine dehydrogenase-like NADP-dependent oxidoreductase
MQRVMVLGAGRIGRCIAEILHSRGDILVTLGDQNRDALLNVPNGVLAEHVDVRDVEALGRLLKGYQAVLSACQFGVNAGIARAALASGASYFDLTEDVATTHAVREIAGGAGGGQVFVPQCGLAPGYIGILGAEIARRFDELHTLKLRVGALPEMPNNAMLYNLTWSTEGLINEYCNLCDAIKQGKLVKVQPLEGLETFVLEGAMYEAFNTSGGLGTLCEALEGRVHDLTYKTIRYPGHRHLVDFLVNGLRLGEAGHRRDLLKQIFEDAVPVTDQDVVLIVVSATGYQDGKLVQVTEHHRIKNGCAFDHSWSAIQIATASSACVVVDMFLRGTLCGEQEARGFISQEEIPFSGFMLSPWAKAYRESGVLFNREAIE